MGWVAPDGTSAYQSKERAENGNLRCYGIEHAGKDSGNFKHGLDYGSGIGIGIGMGVGHDEMKLQSGQEINGQSRG
jgi:hypothetical protein